MGKYLLTVRKISTSIVRLQTFKDEAQAAVFKDPVRTAL
jgi:hypothetical protein